jgi:hypothetical protein
VFLSRSNLYRDAGRNTEALQDCREAAAIFEQAVAVSPSDRAVHNWLAVAYQGQALTYQVQRKRAEELVAWQQTLAVVEKVQRDHTTEQGRRDVAGIQENIARLRPSSP